MEVGISFTLKYRCLILIFLKVWAATCRNEDYVRIQGMKRTINDSAHRKELVAGNLEKKLTYGAFLSRRMNMLLSPSQEFLNSLQRVADKGGDFFELRRRYQFRDRLSSISLLSDPLKEIPQVRLIDRLQKHTYPSFVNFRLFLPCAQFNIPLLFQSLWLP